MLYSADITIPANTPQATPAQEVMTLTFGTVTHMWAAFPPGPRGMVYVAVFCSLFQVAPATPGRGLSADGYTISFPTEFDLSEPPYQLIIKGWSPGSAFAHTVTLSVALDVSTTPAASQSPTSLLARLSGLFD